MGRNVRVIDSVGYSRGGVIRPDVEVMEINGRVPYRRRWSGREPLALVLILALVAMWVYRNSGAEGFGRRIGAEIGAWIPSPRSVPPSEINTTPVGPPSAPVEGYPGAPFEPRPVITAEQQSDIMGYSRIAAQELNLRERPGFDGQVLAVLTAYRDVAILRQSHVTPDGDVWVEVLAETSSGRRKGWVMRQYLESCDCPVP